MNQHAPNESSAPDTKYFVSETETVESIETAREGETKYFVSFALIALCVFALDQISKVLIRRALPLGGKTSIVPGWLDFSHVLNHGAAWGMLSGRRWLLIFVACGVIAVVVMLAREMSARSVWARGGLGFILGGALGNLFDRIAFGAVTDFIDLDTPWRFLKTFPVWNLADAALTVGVVMLAIDFLRARKD